MEAKRMHRTRGLQETIREFIPRGAWLRFRQNKPALVGLIILIFLVLIGVMAPVIAPFDPTDLVGEAFLPPGFPHLMGTDQLGRDIFSRILHGAGISLFIGFIAGLSTVAIGGTIGAVSAYYGGRVDEVIMRLTEIMMIIPTFFIVVLVIALYGSSIFNVILIIAVTGWPSTARLIRSKVLSLKERAYVEAAISIGSSKNSIIFGEIAPNTMNLAIVNGSLRTGGAILMYAGLSFLGLGDPTSINWGGMLKNAMQYLRVAWWAAIFPGFAITLTVLSLNLVADGLNDALNPRGLGAR
jgi:peptide/nickel transport system permease protein